MEPQGLLQSPAPLFSYTDFTLANNPVVASEIDGDMGCGRW